MSGREIKFYVINFIDPQIIFLKRKFWHHVQWKHIFRYHIKKSSRKVCARTINGSKQFSYWCSGTFIFLECSSMLNASPVTNVFLGYTWLGRSFFSEVFFSTSWLDFSFTGYLIMYWWKRTPCVVAVVIRKPLRKICGVIASKWILFI